MRRQPTSLRPVRSRYRTACRQNLECDSRFERETRSIGGGGGICRLFFCVAGNLNRAVQDWIVNDAYQANSQRFFCLKAPAGKEQLRGACSSNQTRQSLRTTPASDDAQS